MNCWVPSIKEARTILNFQEHHLHEISKHVFPLLRTNALTIESLASSENWTYSPLVIHDLYLTNTTLDTMSLTEDIISSNSSTTNVYC